MPISPADLRRRLFRLLLLPFLMLPWLAGQAGALEIAIGGKQGPTYGLGIGISSLVKVKLLPTDDIDLNAVITAGDGESLQALRAGEVDLALIVVGEGASPDGPELRAVATLGKTGGGAKTLLARSDVDDRSVHRILDAIFESIGFLSAIEPQLQTLDPDDAVMGLALPLHGGAKGFYADWWSSPGRESAVADTAPASPAANDAAAATPATAAVLPGGPAPEETARGGTVPADARSYVLYFDFDDASLTAAAETTLREAANFATTLRSPAIIVAAYTDSVGAADYNYLLAERRAGSVMSRLEELNVRYSKMDLSLFGERSPWAVTLDGVNEAENRRVELFIEEPVPEVEPLPLPAGFSSEPRSAGEGTVAPRPAGGPRERLQPTRRTQTM